MPAARKFTKIQITEMIEQYQQGVSVNVLTAIYNCDARVIKRLLGQNGVLIRPASNLIGNEQEIVSRYVDGESMESLSRRFKIDPRYVRKTIRNAGVNQRTLAQANRRCSLDETFFDIIDTEAKAYFLGFLYADGCNNTKEGRFAIGLQYRDKAILEVFRGYLNYGGELRLRPETNKATLTVGSRYMSDRLTELGCTAKKSFTLAFPDWLEGDMLRHFIRGFIDGDGCYYVGKRCTYISAISSSTFIRGLGETLSHECKVNFGIQPHCSSNGIDYVKIYGAIQCQVVVRYLYKNATICLQRKKDKADAIMPSDNTGENCHLSFLNSEEVLMIKDQIKKGIKPKVLADRFEVSKSAIEHIKYGRSWKHV